MFSAIPRIVRLTRNSASVFQKRSFLTLKDHKYTAHATASGAGRNGNVVSNDGTASPLDLTLAMPKALGGTGLGANPEQLFASGYSSCFLGALQVVAAQQGKKDAVKDAKVNVNVHIGPPTDRPGLALAISIKIDGVKDQTLIDAAHDLCPYSRALKHGAEVNVSSS